MEYSGKMIPYTQNLKMHSSHQNKQTQLLTGQKNIGGTCIDLVVNKFHYFRFSPTKIPPLNMENRNITKEDKDAYGWLVLNHSSSLQCGKETYQYHKCRISLTMEF